MFKSERIHGYFCDWSPLNKRYFALTRPWRSCWLSQGSFYFMELPIGFQYDGASIPGWAKSIIGGCFDGPYLEAATVHDGLYELQWDRKESDQIFYDLMTFTDGNSYILRRSMYKAVRLGGSNSWKNSSSINTHLLGQIKVIKTTPDDPKRLASLINAD